MGTEAKREGLPWLQALCVTLFLRLFYSVLAAVLPGGRLAHPVLAASNSFESAVMRPSQDWRYLIYGVWERFDSLWYVHIAQHGYDRAQATVFYPFYPLLIRCLTPITGEPFLAALVISTVASFFLFWGLQKLFLTDEQKSTVARAIFFLAVWPASFVLFAAYPDSLAAALVVWSVFAARRGKWHLAGFLGFLAGITKASGALVCVPLFVLAVESKDWLRLGNVVLAGSGVLAYQLWVRLAGFPPVSTTYSALWNTSVAFPWDTLWRSFRAARYSNDLLLEVNLAAIVIIAVSILAAWPAKVRKREYLWYSIAALVLFLVKQTSPLLQSSMRYLLAVFPVFLVCAKVLKWRILSTAIGFLLLTGNVILFNVFLAWGLVV